MRDGNAGGHFFLFLALLCIWMVACSTDPLERPGPYDIYVSPQIAIPNPEDPSSPIPAKYCGPSLDGGLSISDGLHELVILMPGFGITYEAYAVYARHMASHGSIVAAMNFVQTLGVDGKHDYLARQTLYVLDYLVGAEGPLAGHVDVSKIATAGHSLGGKIAFYAAALDPRIRLVMAMDPSNGGGPPCFISEEWCNAYPVAPNIVTGDPGLLDGVNAASFIMRAVPDAFNPDPQSNAEYFFLGTDGQGTHAVGSPALYFDMGESGHASWVFLGNPNVPRITMRTMVAWIRAHFRGEALDDYFTGDIVQADVDAGSIVTIGTR